ncbi:hypothetical protein BDN70DRAFT_932101 [Pholiota conissans]|uniref:Uncharacterized protein n=1 Tax=Pholiota conissans TaxID=109636 RepID=A0A9P5Z2K2_9AGAR|nr:hypothetical protein BDN70DRAFT_932101 [Pholiota conissans]
MQKTAKITKKLWKLDLSKASLPIARESSPHLEPIPSSARSAELANYHLQSANITVLEAELPYSPPVPSPLRNVANLNANAPSPAPNVNLEQKPLTAPLPKESHSSSILIQPPLRSSSLRRARQTIFPDENGIYHSPLPSVSSSHTLVEKDPEALPRLDGSKKAQSECVPSEESQSPSILIQPPPRSSSLRRARKTIYPDENGIYHSPLPSASSTNTLVEEDVEVKAQSGDPKTTLGQSNTQKIQNHSECSIIPREESSITLSSKSSGIKPLSGPERHPDSFPQKSTYFFSLDTISAESDESLLYVFQGQSIPLDVDPDEDPQSRIFDIPSPVRPDLGWKKVPL